MDLQKNILIFGKITIEAVVNSTEEVLWVDFYFDDYLKCNDSIAPYSCVWDERAFFKHTIKAIAHTATDLGNDALVVWKFF